MCPSSLCSESIVAYMIVCTYYAFRVQFIVDLICKAIVSLVESSSRSLARVGNSFSESAYASADVHVIVSTRY